jgi:endonuclease-3
VAGPRGHAGKVSPAEKGSSAKTRITGAKVPATPPPIELRKRAQLVNRRLTQAYPDARCSLDYRTPLELLIATILSAQCTDERVNMVTPDLFRRFPDAEAYASAPIEDITALIRSTGFFNNKAKSIQGAARRLTENYGGRVPDTMEEILTLPGVARKTANVVLGNAYGKASGVVVDTHVQRITRLLGLTREKDPKKIERDLMLLLPESEWVGWSHRLIQHGRRICIARRPRCGECVVASLCPSAEIPIGSAKISSQKAADRKKTRARPQPAPSAGPGRGKPSAAKRRRTNSTKRSRALV